MGEKDIAEKILEDYPDVFADIVNGFLFDGEEVIKPRKNWRTCRVVPPTVRKRNSTIWSGTWLSGGRKMISVLPA